MALTTDFSVSLLATLTTDLDLGPDPSYPLDFSQRVKLATGTGAGNADLLWSDERTLTASSTETLDLVGTLTDAFGATFSPARIKALIVKADADNTNNVVLGDAVATTWAALLGTDGTIAVRPGATFAVMCGDADATGYVCAAGSTDSLLVTNSGAGSSVTYQIILVGVSA